MITFNWLPFNELSLKLLYDILRLRSEVFVVEQNCVYLDPDGKDITAQHLLGTVNGELVAYMRLLPPQEKQPYLIFGRIVTSAKARKNNYGKQLMTELLAYRQKHFPDEKIHCSAQLYLKKFYENFGFVACSEQYDEDGIPHIAMECK